MIGVATAADQERPNKRETIVCTQRSMNHQDEENGNCNEDVDTTCSMSEDESDKGEEVLMEVQVGIPIDGTGHEPSEEKEESLEDITVDEVSFPSDIALASNGEVPTYREDRHEQDENTADRSIVSAPVDESTSPGAFSVRGMHYRSSHDFDADDFSGETETWRDPNVDSDSRHPDHHEEDLVEATAVREEEPVVAEHVRLSLCNDRRVQAVIFLVFLAGIGLIAWGFSVGRTKEVVDPTASPTPAPTQILGTFQGTFCSQNPDIESFGGDSCISHCQSCNSPNERLSLCWNNETTSHYKTLYCAVVSQHGSRPCGNVRDCPVDHYCVECKHYAHSFVLEGSVCFPHRDDVGVDIDGYNRCLALPLNGGSPTPTPEPTLDSMPTKSPSIPPTAAPTESVPTPTITPLPTATTYETFQPSLAPSQQTLGPVSPIDIEALLTAVSLDDGTALNTPGTPQNMAFEQLMELPNLDEYSRDELYERYALTVFFFSTNGQQWNSSVGWLSENETCVWEFVSCGDSIDGSVVSIDAPRNNMIGILPSELYLLAALEALRLDDNGLSGQVPSEIGRLTNLVNVTFHNNSLGSELPSQLGSLTNLQILDLDSNRLTGTISTHLGRMLNAELLYLNNNGLNGTIPSELGEMTNLHALLLSSNNLTGTVPHEVCELGLDNLQVFSVDVEVVCNCTAFADACHPVGSKI